LEFHLGLVHEEQTNGDMVCPGCSTTDELNIVPLELPQLCDDSSSFFDHSEVYVIVEVSEVF